LQLKSDLLGLVERDHIMFLAENFSSKIENKHEFSFCLFVAKQLFLRQNNFFCMDTDHTMTYQILISFVALFTYLEFLDTRLSLDLSFFFQYLWFFSITLPLAIGSIKLDFQLSSLLSTSLQIALILDQEICINWYQI
jgi:hypothetical protein